MKNLNRTIETIVLASFIVLMTLNGCQKTENRPYANPDQLIADLNSFDPSNDVASKLASSFIAQRKKPSLKSTIDDKGLDEGIWLTEAFVNYEKGFKKDSIEYLVIDTTLYTVPIESWSEGIPVIDGAELNNLNDFMIDRINTNEQNEFLFWATYINIIDIEQDIAQLEIINAGGPRSYTRRTVIQPKLPGADLMPFEDGYTTRAGYGGYSMQYAEKDFWDRISTPESYFDSEIALVLVSQYYKSAYIAPGVADSRLFWNYGTCESYWMNSDELNQYLLSSKELIDENNPAATTDEYVIGYFHWNCWNNDCYPDWCFTPGNSGPYYGHWFEHAVSFYIYKKVPIIPPID